MASTKNYMLNDEFPKRIKNATSSSDGLMSSEDKSRIDNLFEFGLLSPATPDKDGVMTKEDKTKLEGIEEKANYYIHPDTHLANIIIQDESHRFVTDTQIAKWDNIVIDDATTDASGLMSPADKTKLDNLENYVHPNNENIRHVTDVQIAYWNAKMEKISYATQTNDGIMSADDKKKLDSISANANNFIHPTGNHVTDEQIAYWNNKASTAVATKTSNGLMSSTDKNKLDGIEDNANNYVHPDNSQMRHVTDEQIAKWNSGITNIPLASESSNGLMSSTDKIKLDMLTIGDGEGGGKIDEVLNRILLAEAKLRSAVYYKDENTVIDNTLDNTSIESILTDELLNRLTLIEDRLKNVVYYS